MQRKKIGKSRLKTGETCFWMSKHIDLKYVGFFKRTENCPDNCKNIGQVFANNTCGLRRLKCSVINTVNLKEEITYGWTYCNRLFIEK